MTDNQQAQTRDAARAKAEKVHAAGFDAKPPRAPKTKLAKRIRRTAVRDLPWRQQ